MVCIIPYKYEQYIFQIVKNNIFLKQQNIELKYLDFMYDFSHDHGEQKKFTFNLKMHLFHLVCKMHSVT